MTDTPESVRREQAQRITASQVRARADALHDAFDTVGCGSVYMTPDDQAMLALLADLLERIEKAPVAMIEVVHDGRGYVKAYLHRNETRNIPIGKRIALVRVED